MILNLKNTIKVYEVRIVDTRCNSIFMHTIR